ncbi:NAD(P)H-dependent glycerol-3-phosphate dehydrogenase [Comamonas resistens]|uniref:Glycerol-3-phosphate dehydrogenase [NAD(P)+] n=1 Tax=Comamonas resistens TaxID=3046670 RepID=A0ABY8SQF3_9BURK|nr:NAD(P)H-dependent glycerol-3-phosphate dehydrogenase [Comamonas resistens]MDL5038474.1 NAD(P)H-dependent glycerol-3-phosphate dehydrogenase [Comamonas resistens]WHS64625.1 NAD(P)H-dependent glycerol-3-phosphate dehydrogenase [Comamonas resistens]
MNILVIGAGAWGTAMAISAATHPDKRSVRLWARDEAQARQMQAERANSRYLAGIAFPDALQVVSGDVMAQVQEADLIVLGTPMAALRQWLIRLQDCRSPVVWLCKGFEAVAADAPAGSHGLMAHEVCQQVAPQLRSGALSGPSFAAEVARQQPTALVAASAHKDVSELLVSAFHGEAMRVYANEDIVGVEVGGAVKNVLAIATGLCDGLSLGLNARAALVTRGLAEMTRLGVALGARVETFMGLSGLGDLVLTATGDLSRNRKVGLLLAEGKTLEQAVTSLGHVAEGVYSARTVLARARQVGVEMPITETVVALLDGQLPVTEAVQHLMARDPRGE